MILSARFLKDVCDVNSFDIAENSEFTEGDVLSVYFQVVDSSVNRPSEGFNPSGRRYMPASGATLQCVVANIDDSVKITRYASNPFPEDKSIWKLDFMATDKIRGTSNLQLLLTEGTKVTRGVVKAAFRIYPKI